jgi:hypothetical protein
MLCAHCRLTIGITALCCILLLAFAALASDKTSLGPGKGNNSVAKVDCRRTTQDFDINLDGNSLTVADLVALRRYIVEGSSAGPIDPYAADFNGDCFIDYGDAFALDSLFKFGLPICDPGPGCFSCRCDHTPVFGCCYGTRGNLNMDPNDAVDLADLSALISYLGGNPAGVRCLDAANINGVGPIDLADLSALVNFLTGGGFVPAKCPQ